MAKTVKVVRSAVSGRFVKTSEAKAHPKTAIPQTIKRKGK